MVAALNLLNLLEHGCDLRGKEHAALLAEAQKMRIVVDKIEVNPPLAADRFAMAVASNP